MLPCTDPNPRCDSVELVARGLLAASGQVSVRPVDHLDARAHVPHELEMLEAYAARARRERVQQRVDSAVSDAARFCPRVRMRL
jgi:hypothetical protein